MCFFLSPFSGFYCVVCCPVCGWWTVCGMRAFFVHFTQLKLSILLVFRLKFSSFLFFAMIPIVVIFYLFHFASTFAVLVVPISLFSCYIQHTIGNGINVLASKKWMTDKKDDKTINWSFSIVQLPLVIAALLYAKHFCILWMKNPQQLDFSIRKFSINLFNFTSLSSRVKMIFYSFILCSLFQWMIKTDV